MPIYDYSCSACGRLTEVVHAIHDHGPRFCPECGEEGTMKKSFAPPTIHFRGSGWAKKDRGGSRVGTKAKSADKPGGSSDAGSGGSSDAGSGGSSSGTAGSAAAD